MRAFLCWVAAALAIACAVQPAVADVKDFRKAEKEFKDAQSKGDAKRMTAAVEAIGAAACKEALEFLLDTVEKDQRDAKIGKGLPGAVRETVVNAVSNFNDEASVERIGKAIASLKSDKDPVLALDQYDFLKSLAGMRESASAAKVINAALADKKNPYIKVAALEAIRQARNPNYVDAVQAILSEPTDEWFTKWRIVPINVFCCLEDTVTPNSEQAIKVVETFCTQWEQWHKARGFNLDDRVKYFGSRMLYKITGEAKEMSFVVFWKWWLQQKKTGNNPSASKPSERSTDSGPPPAFGVKPVGKRWVFVIDVSDSMKLSLKISLEEMQRRARERRGGPVTGDSKEAAEEEARRKAEEDNDPLKKLDWRNITTKHQLATAELSRAIKEFPEGYYFSIVTYSTEVKHITKGWVLSTQTNRDKWSGTARDLQLEALTNIHGGLMKAMRISDKGDSTAAPSVDADCVLTGADTIIFLTDGWSTWSDDSKSQSVQDKRNPNNPVAKVGDGTRIYGEDIWPDIVRHNLFRKVLIHTIGIGNHDKECLKMLAEKTGGTYVDWGFPE